MILVNGYIANLNVNQTPSNGIDTDGFAITTGSNATETEGELIECQFRTVNQNNIGKIEGNTVTLAEYTALIESKDYSSNFSLVKLYDKFSYLGKYSVIRTDRLNHLNQVKLYLKKCQ